RRLRRRRGHRGRRQGLDGRRAATAHVRHRRRGSLGRRAAVRRRDRRLGRTVRAVSVQEDFAQIAREDGRAALVTVVRGPHLAEKLLVRPDGTSEGTLGDPELDAQGKADAEDLMWKESSEVRGDLFIDVTNPDPRIVIFGAVEYAQHLSALARIAGWRPYVVDPRARFATPERFPDPPGA